MIIQLDAITEFRKDYFFLSNFYVARSAFDGVIYMTSEHAYMASKTLNFNQREKIQSLKTAREARDYGQTVSLRPGWDNVKYMLMKEVLFDKFTRNKDIQKKLLDTGKKQLVEGGLWHDQYWGICNCAKHQGEGKNALGQILMEIRQEIKDCLVDTYQ